MQQRPRNVFQSETGILGHFGVQLASIQMAHCISCCSKPFRPGVDVGEKPADGIGVSFGG